MFADSVIHHRFHSDLHRETPIDLFVNEPFDIDELRRLHGEARDA